ncbi:putative papain-like cysteine peptidase superfamily [Helianthus anomalus]
MGLAAGSSSEILSIKKCELLHLDDQGALKVVAIGRVHPTDDRVVHGCPIIDGFVKVQIDRVVEGCGLTRLLPESCIYGEIELLKDPKGSFIQWPVKINKGICYMNNICILISLSFEATPADQQQAIPNERNEYQIYSYALQDDETFNQLFSENTTAEHVSFHKPTELVHAYQHTKPVIANQPTKTVHANQSTEPIRDCQHTKPIVVASKSSTEKIKVSKEKIKVLELLEMARSRPQNIYRLAQKVALHSEKALFTVFTSTTGMYEERVEETVEFEAVIQLCVNGELVSDDGDFVIDHIKKVSSFHKDKQWFIAPYIVGKHWVLIILQHHPVYKTWKGYIFDSRKCKDDDDYSCYEITTLFEQAIEENMTWAKVKCRLQPNGWECSYCVMLAMYDFVIRNREHMLANKTKMVRHEIDEFVERTLKVFISSFGDVEDEKGQ